MGIWKSVKNMFREKREQVESYLEDPTRDNKWNIVDAENEVKGFEKQWNEIRRTNLGIERKIKEAEAEIVKYDRIATQAGEKGNVDDVNVAVAEIQRFENTVSSLKADLKANTVSSDNLRSLINKAKNKIATAKQRKVSLDTRAQSAKLRRSLANIDESKFAALSQLESYEDKIEADEDLLAAQMESASIGNEAASLEDKYKTGTDISDRAAKYLKNATADS